MRTWVKLYTDIPDDYKMEQMTDRQFRVMVYAFAHAGKVDDDGRLGPLAEVAWKLRRPAAEVQEDFTALAALHILHEQDGQWYVTHFAERNARAPSDKPEAVRARVGRHRERAKQSNDAVTALHINGNAKETPLEEEVEVEEEVEGEEEADARARVTAAATAAAIPAEDKVRVEYEQATHRPITQPAQLAQLDRLEREHGTAAVLDAIAWCATRKAEDAANGKKADDPYWFGIGYVASRLKHQRANAARNGAGPPHEKQTGYDRSKRSIAEFMEEPDGRQDNRGAGGELPGRRVPQLRAAP